jgi:hypothetical protein
MDDMTDSSCEAMQDGSRTPTTRPAPAPSHANAIHLLRTMQAHHVTLSAMADQKASIIIGVNSVIFALVVKEAATNPALLVLAASSGLAAVLCMLAVLPALGGTGRDRGPAPPPNLLFFAGFTRLPEAEWIDWLQRTNADDHAIQQAMARDVYQLGQVLANKKYKYLGWGYRVFIGGLVTTLAVFLLQTAVGL